jgi:hypothetical protein
MLKPLGGNMQQLACKVTGLLTVMYKDKQTSQTPSSTGQHRERHE